MLAVPAAVGATAAYAASITMDDGLEVLVYFPCLGVLVGVAAIGVVWGLGLDEMVRAATAILLGALFGMVVLLTVFTVVWAVDPRAMVVGAPAVVGLAAGCTAAGCVGGCMVVGGVRWLIAGWR